MYASLITGPLRPDPSGEAARLYRERIIPTARRDFRGYRGMYVLTDPASREGLTIALYDTALFAELPRGEKLKMLPLYVRWIEAGIASGERYDGPWYNVGSPADLAALDRYLTP